MIEDRLDDIRRIEDTKKYYIICVANSGRVYHLRLNIKEDGNFDHDVVPVKCDCHEKALVENKKLDWENKNI